MFSLVIDPIHSGHDKHIGPNIVNPVCWFKLAGACFKCLGGSLIDSCFSLSLVRAWKQCINYIVGPRIHDHYFRRPNDCWMGKWVSVAFSTRFDCLWHWVLFVCFSCFASPGNSNQTLLVVKKCHRLLQCSSTTLAREIVGILHLWKYIHMSIEILFTDFFPEELLSQTIFVLFSKCRRMVKSLFQQSNHCWNIGW